MIKCKGCEGTRVVKNGIVREQQRYKCKECKLNFIEGDKRVKQETAVKRSFAVILYSLGKASYGFIAKLFGVTPPAVQKWLKQEAALLHNPNISSDISEIEFDEMWHFIGSKKRNSGSSKRWIVAQGEPLPGLQAVVMLQPSEGFMTKSSI